jgi:hypothetical protein
VKDPIPGPFPTLPDDPAARRRWEAAAARAIIEFIPGTAVP